MVNIKNIFNSFLFLDQLIASLRRNNTKEILDDAHQDFPLSSRMQYEASQNGYPLLKQSLIIKSYIQEWEALQSIDANLRTSFEINSIENWPDKYKSIEYWKQPPTIGEYGFVKSSIPLVSRQSL